MPGKIPIDQIFQQSPIGETNEVVPAGNTNIFQRALAEILGLPVDLTNAAITGVLKAVGLPEYVIEDPIGGRAWLMDNTGITTDDLQAAITNNFVEVMSAKSRFMERVKQSYSDMLIPDEEIASKPLNQGHVGSGWLPDFVENASIMWNRELMRAAGTPYTTRDDIAGPVPVVGIPSGEISIDLQTSSFKKAVDNIVPEENTLLDFFIQPAHAPTDTPVDYEDAFKMYDFATDADAFPRSIKAAQAINSVYYWDGEGEKQIALYKGQLEHFKKTPAYSPTVDESALTQAANWMESASLTGMRIDFDEIGGSTNNQLTNAWDTFKSATTLDEATAALSNVTQVSTGGQPTEDVGFLEQVGTGLGKFYSDLWEGSLAKKGIDAITPQTPTEQLNQIALDSIALGPTESMEAEKLRRETAMIPDDERFVDVDYQTARPSIGGTGIDYTDPGMEDIGLPIGGTGIDYADPGMEDIGFRDEAIKQQFEALRRVEQNTDFTRLLNVPAGAHPSGLPSLDEIPQVIGTFPNTNDGARQANEMVRVLETQGIESTVNPPTTESGVYSVTAQPDPGFQFDDIIDPHKYTTSGARFSGLSSVYESPSMSSPTVDITVQDWVDNQNIVGTFPDTEEGQDQAVALQRDLQSQGKHASVMSPMSETDGLITVIDHSAVPAGAHPSGLPSINELQENISDQAVLPAETVVPKPTEEEEQSWWDNFKDSLTGPTVLGQNPWADTVIREQMAEEARKNTALMGTGPTMDIDNLPLSTWEDTPFAMDAGDLSGDMTNQNILDQLTDFSPANIRQWGTQSPNMPGSMALDPTWAGGLRGAGLGAEFTASSEIFVGLEETEKNALMTDNSLMTDYLAAREVYKYPVYDTGGPKFEHEDYYPGSQAAANAAGFNFFGATPFNPAYNEYKDAQRMLMGIAPGEMFKSEDWIGTFGPKGVATAANINAMTGMLQDEYFSSDDPATGTIETIDSGINLGPEG